MFIDIYLRSQVSVYRTIGPLVFIFRAGKPMPGLHLDVTKEGKMVQVQIFEHCLLVARNVIKSQFSNSYDVASNK